MPPRRIGPTRTDVTLRVDGEDVPALAGEPIAVSLAAAGRLVLGRSVKYHRPRGAVCYAARCDGCLMRVGGVPSRMTCRVKAEHGTEIETQNVLGLFPGSGAEHDLLAAADWFFPGGMNHHQMFTWSKAANRAMQTVARRIAGIGELPSDVRAPIEPIERTCDLLVIGGGPTGLAAATRAARDGLDVLLVDEEERAGGHLAYTPGVVQLRDGEATILARAAALQLAEDARAAGVTMLARCSVLGVFSEREDAGDAPFVALADEAERASMIRGRRLICAQGRHEGAWAFEGNDLPGVIGSDAACRLLAHGVLCGERVVLAGPTSAAAPGATRLAALASALSEAGAEVLGPFELSSIARARGRHGVSTCDVRRDGAIERLDCDALVIAPPTSAVYELAEQAGAEVTWRDDGFQVVASAVDGATRVPWVRAVGRAAGVASLAAGIAQASAAAGAIGEELRA